MPLTNYIKTAWVNGGTPAINSTNLNKIETQLYDLTEEAITPAYSSETTATQSVISLPSSAIKGQLDSTLLGNTHVNIVLNGNFTSTTGWTSNNSSSSVSNNVLTNTANGTNARGAITQTRSVDLIKQGDKIYQSVSLRVTNSSCLSLRVRLSDGVTSDDLYLNNPVSNQWYKLSRIYTIVSATPISMSDAYSHHYVDTATSNGKVMEVKEGFTINLTNLFGAGNEPTQAQADLIFANWFDGVKSTDRQIVKSVGKNLLPSEISKWQIGTLLNGNNSSSSTSLRTEGFIKIKEATTYSRSIATGYVFSSISCYDNLKQYITAIAGTTAIPSNTAYLRFVFRRNDSANISLDELNIARPQLEQGTVATTYEPYTETTAIMSTELKKISSTIYDTYDANSGQHTKNCSDWVNLTGSLTWAFSSDYTGYKTFYALQSSNSSVLQNIKFSSEPLVVKYNNKKLSYEAGTSAITNGDICRIDNNSYINSVFDTDTGWDEAWVSGTSFTGMTWANLIKAYMNGWKLTTANTNVASCVWTGISSGTTQSGSGGYSHVIANIDTGYTPYRMIYQLATPIVTNYYANVLNANPSGTVYVYPFINDFDFYSNGVYITDSNYPIQSLEYVNKINRTNGAITPIAISTCTLAGNGLSFTSTALTSNDLVDFGYIYKDKSTQATMTYNYAQSLKGQVNSNSEQIEKLDEKTVQLEEQINVIKSSIPIYLSELELTADTSQVNFSIPSGFSKIEYECHNIMTTTASDTEFTIILNDDTTAGNYLSRSYRSDGTNNTSYYNADAGFITHSADGIVGQSTYPGYIEGNITNIQTQSKKIRQTANDYNVDRSEILIGVWNNTSSEINKLSFKNVSGNIKAGALFKVLLRK